MRQRIGAVSAAFCMLLCGCGRESALPPKQAAEQTVCAAENELAGREAASAQHAAAWAVQHAMFPEEIRALLAHDYLLRVCRYDAAGTSPYSAYGALNCGAAVCTGYAEGFRALCTAAGIACVTVHGIYAGRTGETPHAWNLVRLHGVWYHVDCTHDDTEDAPRHACFLRSDAEMAAHYRWDRRAYPAAEGGELSFGAIVEKMRNAELHIDN